MQTQRSRLHVLARRRVHVAKVFQHGGLLRGVVQLPAERRHLAVVRDGVGVATVVVAMCARLSSVAADPSA